MKQHMMLTSRAQTLVTKLSNSGASGLIYMCHASLICVMTHSYVPCLIHMCQTHMVCSLYARKHSWPNCLIPVPRDSFPYAMCAKTGEFPLTIEAEGDRESLIELVLHCCDLSGQTMTSSLAAKWSTGVRFFSFLLALFPVNFHRTCSAHLWNHDVSSLPPHGPPD